MKLYYTSVDGSTKVEEAYEPRALSRYLHFRFNAYKGGEELPTQHENVVSTLHEPSNQAEIIEEFRSLCLKPRGKYYAIMREAILTTALPETLAAIRLLGLLDIEVLDLPF